MSNPAAKPFSLLQRAIANAWRCGSLNPKARAKVVLRILYKPLSVMRIEAMLQELDLDCISRLHPRVYEKPYRPYLASGLGATIKVDLLGSHYRLLRSHLGRDQIEQMYASHLPLLTNFLAPMQARLELRYDPQMEKEGELTLWLSFQGSTMSSLTFVLHPHALYIGSLQGGQASLEDIRCFTKLCHGVRPHNFMVFLARGLAQHFALPVVLAIRNEAHIYQAKKRTQERIQFDYDAFWGENEGVAADARFFRLPLVQPRRDLAEVASNKRAQYRRRYEFFDACALEFERELTALQG